MQLSSASESHGMFVARSLFTSHLEFIEPTSPAYFFTAGAAAALIVADLLAGREFHRNQVYVRTEQSLYVLEHFAHLKDVHRVLCADYFRGNRGIVLNHRSIRYPRRSSTVGLHVRDAQGHETIDWITLSRQGLREFKKQWLKPARRAIPSLVHERERPRADSTNPRKRSAKSGEPTGKSRVATSNSLRTPSARLRRV
jgi:hypothetical protein